MRILVAPVIVGDRLCRIVSPIDSLLEVEEWAGEWWEPSTVTLTMASQARPATAEELEARGVPPSDRVASGERAAEHEIQALLRAREPASHGAMLDEATRWHGRRRRSYSGNARFRRARVSDSTPPEKPDLRHATDATEWQGPRRRASDRGEPEADGTTS